MWTSSILVQELNENLNGVGILEYFEQICVHRKVLHCLKHLN